MRKERNIFFIRMKARLKDTLRLFEDLSRDQRRLRRLSLQSDSIQPEVKPDVQTSSRLLSTGSEFSDRSDSPIHEIVRQERKMDFESDEEPQVSSSTFLSSF